MEDSATDLTDVTLFCHNSDYKNDYIEIDSRFADRWEVKGRFNIQDEIDQIKDLKHYMRIICHYNLNKARLDIKFQLGNSR